MPSKLKKAIAAMKDQTSISLAKVGGAESSTLEVAILRATTHDEIPVDERYVTEVLRIVSSNRSYAGSCARAVGRRIGRTRSWVVAAKTLMLVLRIFQDGDPHFPKEVLHAMKRGYKILNLNSFRDDSSTTCPWDFTAFVRTFALYLDERLDCFLTGKLQRRTSYNQSGRSKGHSRKREPVVRDMKPSVLLDRIVHWQKLLDRAIATQPTGAARTNELVQICMYTIVQETFDLYRDISDGLALLLDSFFHLQYNNCVTAFQTCVKASKQFEELCTFYDLCKSIGIGRTSEYPSIQKVSEELIETLQEFLKDKSSFPGANGRGAHVPPLSPNSETDSVRRSEYGGSIGTSLGDLIGGDEGYSPERFSDPGREKPPQLEEYYSANDTGSVYSEPADHRGISAVMDLLTLDDPSSPMQDQGKVHQQQQQSVHSNNEGLDSSSSRQGWELVLFETAENQPSAQTPSSTNNHVNHHSVASINSTGLEIDFFSDFNAPSTSSLSPLPNEHSYNPFLEDTFDFNGSVGAPISQDDPFGGYSHTSFAPGTNPSFSSSGFPADFGSSMSAFGSNNAPTFHAKFGNTNENGVDANGSVLPTFSPGYGNGNINSNYQDDFFDDFSRSSNYSSNTNISVFPQGYSDHNRSMSSSLLDDFSHANAPRTAHHARSASGDLSTSAFGHEYDNNARYSVSSPTFQHSRYGSNICTTSSVYSDTFDSFGGYSNGVAQPTFSAEQRDASTNAMNAIVPFGQVGNDSDTFDSFGGYSNGVAQPTFSAEQRDVSANAMNAIVPFGQVWNNSDTFNSFGGYNNGVAQPTSSAEQRDVTAYSMNAIVPFGQVGNDEFFSSGPRLQSTPTFRAKSLDMDQHQGGSLWNENNPFESFPITMNGIGHQQQKPNGSLDQQNDLFNQQQLWLQNQNKIMSKHFT